MNVSNSLSTAVLALVLTYMAVILIFVFRGAKKTKSINDYALGNFLFSPTAVGLSLAASMTSAATFIINPGFVAYYGLSGVIAMAVVLPIAALGSLIILTKGFRKAGQTVKALTMAQWIGNMYKSKKFSLFFAFLSLLLITFIVLICVGLTKVLSASLQVDEIWMSLLLIGFIFGYMMFGGANSMVYTNMVQAILMVTVAIILLGSGFEHFSSGVYGFLDQLTAIDPLLGDWKNEQSPLFRDFFEIVICQLIVGVAIVCQPHIITKSLLLKSESHVNKFLWVAVLTEILFFSVVLVGLYVRILNPELMDEGKVIPVDNVVTWYVVNHFPVYMGLILILGLISAGLSTLEGLIQSLSITITSDIVHPLAGKLVNMDKNGIFINKIVIVLLAVVSFILTKDQLLNPNLSVGIFAQNGVYAYFSAAFFPVLYGTFRKETPVFAAFGASLTAVAVHFSVYYIPLTSYMQGPVKNPGIAAALAIVSSVVIGNLLILVDKKLKANQQQP
ncbi:sodium:solute symporter family transporter [Mongoliitalea daihaiensis]|uniref:sodium:solute symporter family transporter n=1 Tax=Mongoliitalea daihaiensis TaxID=2782006 RepID=UPI001F3E5ED0|nr:sodium:solute symporter [Mongoliitalea daihaiensis]UJP64564.1 sodium:solute symporter [Mongoliitalea daihaiensis]